MNIKFKNLFKSCLLSTLVFTSCDNDDLKDSGLELETKPFILENKAGGKTFTFTIDENPDFVSDLIIKNKIENQEGIISNFIITRTSIEGDIVRNQVIRVEDDIEVIKSFNFDMGITEQFRIWSLRYPITGSSNLPEASQLTNANFFISNLTVTGNDFGLTELEDAIIVNVVPFIPPPPAPEPAPEPIPGLLADFDDLVFNFTSIGGSTFEVVDNPFVEGINNVESRVGKFVNGGTSEFESFEVNLNSPIDFSTKGSRTLRAKIYSESPVSIDFQVINGSLQIETEDEESESVILETKDASKTVDHTGSGWEELVFDFTTGADGLGDDGVIFIPNGTFESIRIIIDGPGSNTGEYFIDDIEFVELRTIVDFDELTASFSPFSDAIYEELDNPFVEGINSTVSKVGKLENTGKQQFEGFSATISTDVSIDFSAESTKTLLVKIYSTTSVPVDFQVTNGEEGARSAAKTVTHGGTGWEILEFDYKVGAIKTFDGSDDQGESFIPEGIFKGVTVLIDGAAQTPGVFYIDDIQLKLN